MTNSIELDEITVEIVKKNIKNLHLRVYPPVGNVRISAPVWMKLDSIRTFVVSKLDWIRQQQKRLQSQKQVPALEYLSQESHYLWGKPYLLNIIESDNAPTLELKDNEIHLQVRQETSTEKKQAILEAWYRAQLQEAVPPLIAKWEPIMGVKVDRFSVRKMKTRWGSCSPRTKSIRLNTELAKKSPECLEYLIIHEMVHLLEPSHNHRFKMFMDQFMPKWRFYRQELNRSLHGSDQKED